MLVSGLAILLVVAVVIAYRARPAPTSVETDARPNIVLIVTDDQRWDTLSVMPNVRRLLGGRGVTFENAFVTTALCCPSRASILTGQASRHTGVHRNDVPDGGAPAFDDDSTLATWLSDAGYETALIGKYLNNYDLLGPTYVPPGWDDWHAVTGRPEISFYGYSLNENGRVVRYGNRPEDYSTSVLTDRAVAFIRQATGPFLLYFAPIAPHLPARPAPEDEGRLAGIDPWRPPSFDEGDVSDKPWAGTFPSLTDAERATTDADRVAMLESLLAVDRGVAEIVRTLEARGELEDTLFVYTSDNGYFWGEHRMSGKVWPYEEAIRVPLVVRGPGVRDPGRTEPGLALNIDLAATVSEAAGVTPGLPQDGRSLMPLLRGEAAGWRDAFVVEFLGVAPPPFEAIRTETHLYVEYRNGWRELYDLRADPLELENRAEDPSYAAIRTALARRLSELLG
ncbi:hypothetical protein BH20ACT24_BH20ACT24_09560 [soil metagenome]